MIGYTTGKHVAAHLVAYYPASSLLLVASSSLIKFYPKVDVTWSRENVRLGHRYFRIAAGLQIRGGMCVIAAENRRYLVLVINDEHTVEGCVVCAT